MDQFHPSELWRVRSTTGIRGKSMTRYAEDLDYRESIQRIALRVILTNVRKLRFAVHDFESPENEKPDAIWTHYKPAICTLLSSLHHACELYGNQTMVQLPSFKIPISRGNVPRDEREMVSLNPESMADRTVWGDALTIVNSLYEPRCPYREIERDGYRFTRRGTNQGFAKVYWRDLILAGLGEAVGSHLLNAALDAATRVETLELAYADMADSRELTADELLDLQVTLLREQAHRNTLDEILAEYDALLESVRAELEALPSK